MRILGLIVEYNPFHQGHLYHVSEARRMCQPDLVLAVMSGHFTQRGEAALVDKWTRAEMAARCGVDVVFELPAAWALRSARDFAQGAVQHLHMAGATHLCFGSESCDLPALERVAEALHAESAEFQAVLRQHLAEGMSYPRARAEALRKVLDEGMEQVGTEPNDILGIEYLLALRRLSSNISPVVIKRRGAAYYDESLATPLASATAIRKALFSGSAVEDLPLPASSQNLLARELALGRGPVTLDAYSQVILHLLRSNSAEQLNQLPDMEDGLSYRLKRMAKDHLDLPSLLRALKTKRYTWTRLQRILCYVLLQLTAERLQEIHTVGPCYLRMLALKKDKSALLAKLPSTLPVISSPAKAPSSSSLKLDELATDLFVLGFPKKKERTGGQDLTRPPVLLE